MLGKWAKFAEGYGKMVLGYFGRTPVPPDPEIVKLAALQMGLPPTTRSPLEMDEANPKKGIAPARAKLAAEGLPETDENLFIVAACGEKGINFLKGDAKLGSRKNTPAAAAPAPSVVREPEAYFVRVDGQEFTAAFQGNQATVNGESHEFSITAVDGKAAPSPTSRTSTPVATSVVQAPMPGLVTLVIKAVGERVARSEAVIVIEAMKLEMPLNAPADGIVRELLVGPGDQVVTGQDVARIDG